MMLFASGQTMLKGFAVVGILVGVFGAGICLQSARSRNGSSNACEDFPGTTQTPVHTRVALVFEQRLAELGTVEYGRIEVQPFELERFGTTFGLVPRPPEEDDDEWAVEVQPGNYMAFFEPWDSGDYDT
jgi:hypothetical protein